MEGSTLQFTIGELLEDLKVLNKDSDYEKTLRELTIIDSKSEETKIESTQSLNPSEIIQKFASTSTKDIKESVQKQQKQGEQLRAQLVDKICNEYIKSYLEIHNWMEDATSTLENQHSHIQTLKHCINSILDEVKNTKLN